MSTFNKLTTPRGVKKITLGSHKSKSKDAVNVVKEEKPQEKRLDLVVKEKAKIEQERLENGYLLLFMLDKTGYLTLSMPSMKAACDGKGLFDKGKYVAMCAAWRSNCLDLVAACKKAGYNYRFNKDWQESGNLFAYNTDRVKKAQ
jgi:hypothetical protein